MSYVTRGVVISCYCTQHYSFFHLGAVNALQDAVILANCIYDMTSINQETITETFNDFREQRYEHVKFQFERSKVNGKLIYGQVKT